MGKKAVPGAAGDEERLVISRVEDAVRSGWHPVFLGFFDLHQQQVAAAALKAAGAGSFRFWGGFEGAERALLGVFDGDSEPDEAAFPLSALRLTWKFEPLTHRDFLGALLSLGIKREKIGDIAVGDGECFVVLDPTVAGFVRQNLDKVGGSGVRVEETDPASIRREQNFAPISDTVASPRLDGILAAIVSLSRGEAAKLIEGGLVSVDFSAETNPAAKLHEGSTVSIRGHGRFIIDRIGPPTRKGRLRLEARRYL